MRHDIGVIWTDPLISFSLHGNYMRCGLPQTVRHERFESVNRYCGYLIRKHELVFSPLSLGASLDEDAISNSVWYALDNRYCRAAMSYEFSHSKDGRTVSA